jgi:DNA recombination protein RmuC
VQVSISLILLTLLAAAAAAAVAWTFAAERRAADLRRTLTATETALGAAQAGLATAQQAQAGLAAALDAERRNAAEKLAVLEHARDAMKDSFAAISAEMLSQNNTRFLALAKEKLGEFHQGAVTDLDVRHKAIADLVQPLRDSLTKVDSKLSEVDRDRATSHAVLAEQLRSLTHAQLALQSETGKLSRALRSPNIRGQWGELQLRRVLEAAGMIEGNHFEIKESAHGEDGRLTPDVVVKLPGGKNVVVDAKVPLQSYLEALETNDEDERAARLRDHARQVRQHVAKLSAKSYWEQFQPAPDFVVLFLGSEAFYSAALEHDPALIETAFAERVLIATPTTLIGLLKTIAYGWQQERVAESARAVSELGRELYDRLAVLSEHFVTLGKRLDGAVAAYNQTVGSLERRVLPTARRFPDLGAGGRKDIASLAGVEHAAQLPQAAELRPGGDAVVELPSAPGTDRDAA